MLHSSGTAATKHSTESVCESAVSKFEHHMNVRRNMTEGAFLLYFERYCCTKTMTMKTALYRKNARGKVLLQNLPAGKKLIFLTSADMTEGKFRIVRPLQ